MSWARNGPDLMSHFNAAEPLELFLVQKRAGSIKIFYAFIQTFVFNNAVK